jgi:hypothetical protein
MKTQPPLKLINVTRSAVDGTLPPDESTLQQLITEKISKIITREYNNT